jgi:hypothetical protein
MNPHVDAGIDGEDCSQRVAGPPFEIGKTSAHHAEHNIARRVDHDPPHAPAPAMHRDLPVGRECVRSSSLSPPSQALSAPKPLAPKNQFRPRFQVDDLCPDLAQKIFRFVFTPNQWLHLAIPPRARGVSRSSRTWRRAAVAASDRSILLNADERSPRGRPSRVVLAPRRWR